MDQKLEKYVFHEAKIGDVFFRAALHRDHAVLYVEDATGWEAQVYLMGSGMPALFYAEAWTIRRRTFGSGWALCHDTALEPLVHLGSLSDGDVRQLIHEFGIHVDFSPDVITFAESGAVRSLRNIIAEDSERTMLFRKNAKWLDGWLDRLAGEAQQPRPNACN